VLNLCLAQLHRGLLQDVEERIDHGLDTLGALHVLIGELALHTGPNGDDGVAQLRYL